jgi:hypothetical protein
MDNVSEAHKRDRDIEVVILAPLYFVTFWSNIEHQEAGVGVKGLAATAPLIPVCTQHPVTRHHR